MTLLTIDRRIVNVGQFVFIQWARIGLAKTTIFNPFDTKMEVLKGDSVTELKTNLLLRKLPMNLGFLNNKQYYLCCFKEWQTIWST